MQRQMTHTVIGRFNAYFEPKRNVIHERAKFHNRNQKEGESVEEYMRTHRMSCQNMQTLWTGKVQFVTDLS